MKRTTTTCFPLHSKQFTKLFLHFPFKSIIQSACSKGRGTHYHFWISFILFGCLCFITLYYNLCVFNFKLEKLLRFAAEMNIRVECTNSSGRFFVFFLLFYIRQIGMGLEVSDVCERARAEQNICDKFFTSVTATNKHKWNLCIPIK